MYKNVAKVKRLQILGLPLLTLTGVSCHFVVAFGDDCNRKAKCLAWHCAYANHATSIHMPADNDQAGWMQIFKRTRLLLDALPPRLGWTTKVL